MNFTNITYSCGHDGYVELPENPKKRESQIKFLTEKASCPDCYAATLAKRDAENKIGCSKVKLSDDVFKAEYSDCKFTKVGITEPNMRYVFIPYERVAAMGVLKALGVKKDTPDYKEQIEFVAQKYLSKDTSAARKKLLTDEHISDNTKERLSVAFDIIEKYQEIISK